MAACLMQQLCFRKVKLSESKSLERILYKTDKGINYRMYHGFLMHTTLKAVVVILLLHYESEGNLINCPTVHKGGQIYLSTA